MNCTNLIDIFSTLANIAIVISVPFLIFQLAEMRRTTLAQSYGVAREILQSEEVRQARKTIFELGSKGKKIKQWSKSEIKSAETVCHTYDSVGQMVRNNLLKRKIIVDSWGHSIQRSWRILEPLIQKYRLEWNSPEVWDDFEWLAKMSENKMAS